MILEMLLPFAIFLGASLPSPALPSPLQSAEELLPPRFHLIPERFAVEPGSPVRFACLGLLSDRLSFTENVESAVLFTEGTSANLLDLHGVDAEGWLALKPGVTGGALFGCEGVSRVIDFPVERLESIASAISRDPELLTKLRASSSPPSVRCTRSACALFSIGQPGLGAVSLKKSSFSASVRLYADPTSIRVGGDLPLRLYVKGEPMPLVKLRAGSDGQEQAQELFSDSEGFARVKLDRPGVWQVEFSAIRAARRDAAAEWVHASHSLVFFVPAAGGR